MHNIMMLFDWIPSGPERLAASIDLPAEPAGQRWPVVIVVHGLTGSRVGRNYKYVELARRLNKLGIACVRFDQSCCGESTGEFQELTIRGIVEDVTNVMRWTKSQPWCDVHRVGINASSMGGMAAVAAESVEPVNAMALWAPIYDMPRVFRNTTKSGLQALLEHQGWVPYKGLKVGKAFLTQLDTVDTAVVLDGSRSPLLLCHSKSDDTVYFEESESYVARCNELDRPCRLETFPFADHDFLEFPDRQRVLNLSQSFFAAVFSIDEARTPLLHNRFIR